MSQYFPPYRSSGQNIKVELHLSIYATKTDLKNVTHVDVSSFALKPSLANLKTEVDKFDIAKLTSVPGDLAKLSNEVKNDVVKKTEYDKLVAKVDNNDATGFVLKTKYDTEKLDLEKKINDTEKKIPNTSAFVKKADCSSKITEIENKIPSISGLATNSALTAVENKIPNVSSLVTKADYNTIINEIEKKITDHDHYEYIVTSEFNKLTTENFKARLAQANLVTKTDFDAELQDISNRITSNKSNICFLKVN